MKKKIVLAVAAALTAMLLAGCADSETQTTAGAGQTGSTQSGTATAQSTQPGAAQSTQSGSDQSAASGTQTGADQSADQNALPTADNSGVDANSTFDAQNQNGPEDDASTSDDADESDPWIGTFKKLDGEVLVISAADNSTVTFSFRNSGIAAMAEATSPYQAVYSGDDDMKVTFNLDEDNGDVTVTVEDADGNAVTDTPLAGEFTKQ